MSTAPVESVDSVARLAHNIVPAAVGVVYRDFTDVIREDGARQHFEHNLLVYGLRELTAGHIDLASDHGRAKAYLWIAREAVRTRPRYAGVAKVEFYVSDDGALTKEVNVSVPFSPEAMDGGRDGNNRAPEYYNDKGHRKRKAKGATGPYYPCCNNPDNRGKPHLCTAKRFGPPDRGRQSIYDYLEPGTGKPLDYGQADGEACGAGAVA